MPVVYSVVYSVIYAACYALCALCAYLTALALSLDYRLKTRLSGQQGQTTAEYALVLLGAAAVALLLVAWATRTNRVGRLLDAVLDQVLSRAR